MREELQALKEQALKELETAASVDALKDLRVKYLGKKGHMTDILRGMGSLPAEERPKIGQIVNEVKKILEEAIAAKAEVLEAEALKQRLASEKVDITLPGRKPQCGHLHPITLTMREIKKIFMRMGFEVLEGPQIESDYYNFEALNLPKDHPARDMQDTFYITEDILLRTQTSPMQARESMPDFFYYLGNFLPLTYYLQILRGILLKGNGLEIMWPQVMALVIFILLTLGASIKKFVKTLN